MKAYKTSQDYSLLRKLLNDGCAIITVNTITDSLNWAARNGEFYYLPSATVKVDVSDKEFIEVCECERITFIEPNN